MDDLIAFLNARLDEDEAVANPLRYSWVTAADAQTADFSHHFDAKRMLREVEAKRAIAAAHGPDPIGKFGSVGEPRCLVCLTDRDGYEEQWEADKWPCLTLRALAAVYSDHANYRPEWEFTTGTSASRS